MDGNGPTQATELLLTWLGAGPRSALLAVGGTSVALLEAIPSGQLPGNLHIGGVPGHSPRRWLQTLSRLGRFDAAVVSDIVETLPETAATTVLAGLRDMHAGRFLLFVGACGANDTRATPEGLLALGLRGLGPVAAGDAILLAYEYDMATYKRTPDWLNARHWAHPERWGRHRW